MPTTSLKEKIRAGEIIQALRVPIEISRDDLERAASKDDYDHLYIDSQHNGYSDEQIVRFCALADDLGFRVQLRIPHTRQAHMIGRFLDLGPSAILVPEVERVETVDEAVAFTYYPPFGKRSWGGDARYGIRRDGKPVGRVDYATWWNETVVLSMQIESVDAVINAGQLARPGVDYLAFGPNDLAFSIEQHPQFPYQTFKECVQHVLDQVKGTDVQVGIATTVSPDDRAMFEEMGVRLFQEAPKA
jgi:2-keto-3-deoxy-L-rhamnonate aldolase RhmA